MKLFAMLSIIVALYLLYRLAFPKKEAMKKASEKPLPKEVKSDGIVGQSRFVLSSRSQPPPTPATPLKSDVSPEKTGNFADENPPMEVEISMEYEEQFPETEDEIDEEAEELRQILGSDTELAAGFSFEEMDMAVGEVNHPSGENEAQAAEVLYRLENTECVTQLAAISPEKAERIKGLISLHVQSIEPSLESDEEVSNLDIADFLS